MAPGAEGGAATRVPAALPGEWLRMLLPHELLRERLRHTALVSAAERCLGSAWSFFALHRIQRRTEECNTLSNMVYVKPGMRGHYKTLGRRPAVART
jgi:hypothetical protein